MRPCKPDNSRCIHRSTYDVSYNGRNNPWRCNSGDVDTIVRLHLRHRMLEEAILLLPTFEDRTGMRGSASNASFSRPGGTPMGLLLALKALSGTGSPCIISGTFADARFGEGSSCPNQTREVWSCSDHHFRFHLWSDSPLARVVPPMSVERRQVLILQRDLQGSFLPSLPSSEML